MTTTPDPMNLMSHPTEETLAELVDGRLTPAARARVIEHIADCAECNDIVMTATELQADEVPAAPPVSRFTPRTLYAAAISLAAAAMLVLVFAPVFRAWFEERRDLDDLRDATVYLEHRRVEGRLSLDLPHQTYQPPMRGPGDPGNQVFDAAVRELRARARGNDWQALHRRGLSELLLRHKVEAVGYLEAAVRQEHAGGGAIETAIARSTRAALLADLSAAYLERNDDDAQDPAHALLAADRSWQLDRTRDAAFNRALALEKLERNAEALAAWREYLKLDSSSPWAQDANTHIQELSPDPAMEPGSTPAQT